VVRVFLDRIYRDFNEQHWDNRLEGLMAFRGNVFHESGLGRILDFKYREALNSVFSSFTPILDRINRGQSPRFEEWADYASLLTRFQTASRQTLAIIQTYKPYLEQLHDITERYHTANQAISNSRAVQDLPFGDFASVLTDLMENNRAFEDEVADIQFQVRGAIRVGRDFRHERNALPNLQRLLRRYQRQLRGIRP
jgi:hypothetical protein